MSPKNLITFSFILIFFIPITSFAKVKGSKYGIYEGKIRIVLNLSVKRDFKVFTLENPRRIVIDIYGEKKVSKLSFPSYIKHRIGKHPWGIRIVLIYKKKFSLKYFSLEKPFRIVIDIYKEDNELYREIVKILNKEDSSPRISEDPIAQLIKKVRSQPLVYEDRVVVIDPGHGGKDPGAIGHGGIREKDINLAIAKKVAYYLKRDGRFKVILTRKGDYFIPLHKRAEIALRNKADLFISVHADAAPRRNPRARGTQIFALSYRRAVEKKSQILKNRKYARLVLGEAADIKSGVVKKVLADLALDVTLSESVYFAKLLSGEMKRVIGKGVYFKGINRAGFAVLKTPGIPSVLVETGFITNPSESKKLRNPEFQRKVAWSIYRAIVRYFFGNDFGKKLVKYR